jgi:hypothetical protein
MVLSVLKRLFADRPALTRVWFGPFRGARIVMNPRNSLRKIFGLYEHELNSWLNRVLPRVTRVLDVGANDGYFTFGCAAAFRRLGKPTGEIIAFEPQTQPMDSLRASMNAQPEMPIRLDIIQSLVGREVKDGMTTLDALPTADRKHTLVKVDVEGGEIDVLEGARTWMDPTNVFLIEVHEERFLDQLRTMCGERGCRLVQVDQRPLFLLGREMRDRKNWWLVSDLDEG